MFTVGRILRKKDWTGTDAVDQRASSAASRRERRKFRCYFPIVRQSVLATVAGFVVIATGGSLCIAGFYAAHQQSRSETQEGNNDTEVFN